MALRESQHSLCALYFSYAYNKGRISTALLSVMSGYQDSNLGPPAPKAGALTGLRYIPIVLSIRGTKVYEKFQTSKFFELFFQKNFIFLSDTALLSIA